MNPKVDEFLNKTSKWSKEMCILREIMIESTLNEEIKWGVPCYTLNNANVVIIHGFKEYCAIMFFKGSLLRDERNLLTRQTENVQGVRQLRFTNIDDIVNKRKLILDYVKEAIEIEKKGLKIAAQPISQLIIPIEFKTVLKHMPELRKAFDRLTPGRKRAYILHFSAPKQSKTKESRIKKYIPHILQGKGLDY